MNLVTFFFSLEPNQLLSTGINALITIVGLWSLSELLRARREVLREMEVVRTLGIALAAHPEEGASARRGRLEATVTESAQGTMVGARVDLLTAIDKVGDSPDPSMLTAQVVSHLERRVSMARWAANGTVLLGLGGTLVGLSIAVTQAMNLLKKSMGDESAVNTLMATFSGLTTAFSTTLCGIIFSMLIGVTVAGLRRRQTQFVEQLELFSLEWIYPHFRSSPGEALARAARHLADIERALHNSLEEVVGGIRQTSAQVKEQGIALTGTIDRSFSALVEESRDSARSLALKWDGVLAHQRQLLGEPDADTVTLPSLAGRLDGAGASMLTLTEGVQRLLPTVEETIARQVDRQARDLHETMHAYTQRLSDAVERQGTENAKHQAQLESLLPSLEERMAAALHSHEEALTRNLAPATTELAETLKTQTQSHAALREATQALSAITSHVDVTLRRVSESPTMRERGDTDRIVAAIEQLRVTLAAQQPTVAGGQPSRSEARTSTSRVDASPPEPPQPMNSENPSAHASASPSPESSKGPAAGPQGLLGALAKKLFG